MRGLLYVNQGYPEIPLKAPKALSHIEAWGIAPANRIAVLASAESAIQFHLVVLKPGVNRAFSAVRRFTTHPWGAGPGWTLMCAPLALTHIAPAGAGCQRLKRGIMFQAFT